MRAEKPLVYDPAQMHFALAPLERVGFSAAGALIIYLISVSIGRWLKRRRGVKLGVFFQLLCIALALYVPLTAFSLEFERGWFKAQRELEAALVLLGSTFIVALLNRFLWDNYFENKRQAEVPKFLRDICAILIVAIAVFFVLGVIYEQRINGLLAGSGIIAIILGFAMQDLLGNVISGIALEIGRPFRPGDWLRVDNTHGQVIDVNWRSVRLRTNDDICLDIPNNQIVRNTIVNLTYPTRYHAMRLIIGIEYGAPPNLVKDALVAAASNAPGVLKNPPPRAYLKRFDDSSIGYEIKFYMEDHLQYNAAVDAIHTNVWYALKRAEIRIPFPIRTLQIDRSRPQEEPRDRAVAALRQNAIFEGLERDQIRLLVREARLDRYGRRERIITQGSDGDSMFVLVSGTAEVFVQTSGTAETMVASLRPGDCFGEMSLLTGEKRSATIVASTDCEVLEIDKEGFRKLLEQKPEIAAGLGELLARRRMENEGVVASSSTEPEMASRRRQYTDSFLAKISTFFGL